MNRDCSAGPQNPRHITQHPRIVIEVLDDIEGDNEIEAARVEGDRAGVRNDHVPDPAVASERGGRGAAVRRADPGLRSGRGEIDRDCAGTAADVEDAQRRLSEPLAQKTPEKHALSGVPPVADFDVVHLGEFTVLHRVLRRAMLARSAFSC